MDANKHSHVQRYLADQQQSQQQVVVYNDSGPTDSNISMDEFKTYVKRWFELDNYVKKAQEVIREKRKEKQKISEVIMRFMCKYNIEDLNTKEGRIRCKSTYVLAPVNKDLVKQRIADTLASDEAKKQELLDKIYNQREKVEKVALRRLKIS